MSVDPNTALIAQQLAAAVNQQISQMMMPLDSMTRAIERIAVKVEDLDRRVIKIESLPHRSEIDKLEATVNRNTAKLEALQDWQQRVEGGMNLFAWFRSSWPLIIALVGALGAYLKFGNPL